MLQKDSWDCYCYRMGNHHFVFWTRLLSMSPWRLQKDTSKASLRKESKIWSKPIEVHRFHCLARGVPKTLPCVLVSPIKLHTAHTSFAEARWLKECLSVKVTKKSHEPLNAFSALGWSPNVLRRHFYVQLHCLLFLLRILFFLLALLSLCFVFFPTFFLVFSSPVFFVEAVCAGFGVLSSDADTFLAPRVMVGDTCQSVNALTLLNTALLASVKWTLTRPDPVLGHSP